MPTDFSLAQFRTAFGAYVGRILNCREAWFSHTMFYTLFYTFELWETFRALN
jgi:hypothetical protein